MTMTHRLACILAILGLSCGASAAGPAAKPLAVVASFSILGDMVRQIGGDAVAVTTLVGPDSDSHGYQPTSADLKAVTQAQLVFVNGLGFDSWLRKLANAAAYQGKISIASKGVTPRTMTPAAGEPADAETAHGGTTDPHAWQDLRNGLLYADNIAAALSAALPDAAPGIQARAAAYKAAMRAVDREVRASIAAVPAAQRVIITSHDAFGYFGAAYGVKFLAPYGLSTETEPSAQDIAKLVDQIRATGVKTVFIENMTNPHLIEQLGKDAGAALGGTLYSDALSRPDAAAPDYLALFRNNVPKLVAAMQANKVAP